jgi:hypothetical protein
MSDLLSDLMSEDAEESVGVPIPQDTDLEQIQFLVAEQVRLEEEVAEAEEALSDKKKQLASISRGKLPEALSKFNLSFLKTTDGRIVEVAQDIHAAITEANKADAMVFLRSSGNDDIIKNDVDLSFGKGQEAESQALQQLLKAAGYSFKVKEYVHPQTLKKFVKDLLEEGRSFPMELFSVFVEKVSKIKEVKKGKVKV